MATIFYVYEHWRPDKDLPFYVGKGKNSSPKTIAAAAIRAWWAARDKVKA